MAEQEAHTLATRTELPLSLEEQAALARARKRGLRWLAGGVVVFVVVAGTSLGFGRPIGLMVGGILALPGLLMGYALAWRGSRDLRLGRKVHYEGPWRFRQAYIGKSSNLTVQLDIAGQRVESASGSVFAAMQPLDISQQWQDGSGVIELTGKSLKILHIAPDVPEAKQNRPHDQGLPGETMAQTLARIREQARERRHAHAQGAGHANPEIAPE